MYAPVIRMHFQTCVELIGQLGREWSEVVATVEGDKLQVHRHSNHTVAEGNTLIGGSDVLKNYSISRWGRNISLQEKKH